MYFDANEILFRHAGGDLCGGFAHAEADFKNRRCSAAKCLVYIQRCFGIRNKKLRPQLVDRAGLRSRQATGACDEAADAVFGRIVKERLLAVVGCVVGHAGCLVYGK
ncbi:hypothetical protein D3C81_1746300 [compost metagenome]